MDDLGLPSVHCFTVNEGTRTHSLVLPRFSCKLRGLPLFPAATHPETRAFSVSTSRRCFFSPPPLFVFLGFLSDAHPCFPPDERGPYGHADAFSDALLFSSSFPPPTLAVRVNDRYPLPSYEIPFLSPIFQRRVGGSPPINSHMELVPRSTSLLPWTRASPHMVELLSFPKVLLTSSDGHLSFPVVVVGSIRCSLPHPSFPAPCVRPFFLNAPPPSDQKYLFFPPFFRRVFYARYLPPHAPS